MESIILITGKLILAIILGWVIGFERESYGKAAGTRTYALVALGSTLFTVISLQAFEGIATVDPSRMIGQIIVGIGFIGAGLIVFDKHHIEGLTTAAALWAAAAVGVAIGVGWFAISIITTILIFFLLFVVGHLEYKMRKKTTLWGLLDKKSKKKKWSL